MEAALGILRLGYEKRRRHDVARQAPSLRTEWVGWPHSASLHRTSHHEWDSSSPPSTGAATIQPLAGRKESSETVACTKTPTLRFLPRGQVFLFDRSHDNVIWIHHFIEMNLRDLRQQLVGVQIRKSVITMNPMHQFSKSDAHRIVYGPVSADGHDGVIILKLRPVDGAPLNYIELNPRL